MRDHDSRGSKVLYLHGFASSPGSRKVEALGELLSPRGIELVAPDLNAPTFRRLNFESMVRRALRAAKGREIEAIAGSSLGALVALAVSRRLPHLPVVLIAPALGVSTRWIDRIPPHLDPVSVFHHARGRSALIHRRFFQEMAGVRAGEQPPAARVTVIMGRLDESVPFEAVEERWREWRKAGVEPGSQFIEIRKGDHGLTGHVSRIAWEIEAAVTSRS